VLGCAIGDILAGVHGGWRRRLNLAGASLPISSLSRVIQISVDLLLSLLLLATKEIEEEEVCLSECSIGKITRYEFREHILGGLLTT
jgi:hypothetical protein